MCDCIHQVEADTFEQLKAKSAYKKPIKKIEMQAVGFVKNDGNGLVSRTLNVLEVELEGQKKRMRLPVVHTFCPFCGERY